MGTDGTAPQGDDDQEHQHPGGGGERLAGHDDDGGRGTDHDRGDGDNCQAVTRDLRTHLSKTSTSSTGHLPRARPPAQVRVGGRATRVAGGRGVVDAPQDGAGSCCFRDGIAGIRTRASYSPVGVAMPIDTKFCRHASTSRRHVDSSTSKLDTRCSTT